MPYLSNIYHSSMPPENRTLWLQLRVRLWHPVDFSTPAVSQSQRTEQSAKGQLSSNHTGFGIAPRRGNAPLSSARQAGAHTCWLTRRKYYPNEGPISVTTRLPLLKPKLTACSSKGSN